MSLEALIQAHTEALQANTAAALKNNELLAIIAEGRQAAIDAIQNTSAATTAATAKTRAKVEPKAEPEAPKTDDYAGEDGLARLKALAVGWLTTDDKTEEANRKTLFGKALTKLEAVGTKGPAIGALAEKNRATLAGWIQTLAAGENVDELADEASGNSLLDD